MRRLGLSLFVLSFAGCAGGAGEPATRAPDVTRTTAAAETTPSPTTAALPEDKTVEKTIAWADATKSRWPLDRAPDARADALIAACGDADGALDRVAREIAGARARGLGAPDADGVDALLRVVGDPHPRARVVSALGRGPLDDDALAKKLASMRRPTSRCGVAIERTPHGGEVAVAVVVDALADLAPLPMRARTGEWLTFDATFGIAAEGARLVVLGPRGAPRTVPTSFDPATGHTRARFALDRPGAFRVQLVADVGAGPRPILEARVFADVALPRTLDAEPAPGEEADAVDGAARAPDDTLARMVSALRVSEGAPALTRDPDLDALARAHADRMRDRSELAHDVGDGDLRARFEARGLFARAVGENVAHAPTLPLAHRALHASPSHRMNLLRADYTHIGVAVVPAADGSVYVCEVFAARARR